MKVISPIFSSMRGKIGGAVGAVSRGGVAYLRSLIIPSNPRSFTQTSVRLVMTALAAVWRGTLTDLQRAGWESISPPSSSGIDSYLKANAQPTLAGMAREDDAPDSLALVTLPLTAPVVDASAHSITFTAIGADPDIDVNVFVSAPQRSSRLSRQFPFTFGGTISDVSAGGSVTLGTTHPAYNLVAGDIVYVRTVQFGDPGSANSGKVASEQEFRCVVVV